MRATALLLAILALAGCDHRPTGDRATVFAASSLRELVTEVAGEWSRRSGVEVELRFEASSTLARQIGEGARADVYVSAAPEWVDAVRPPERYDWLSNRLVLVVRTDAPDVDLRHLESLALAGEHVPAGRYARAALERLGIEMPARTIQGANVRDVLAKVGEGGAEAGIVYATDAAIDPATRIAFTFPPESHAPILYTVALLSERGRGPFEALREPWALDAARRHGFVVPE